tara:strand:+ start:6096 stop:9272 length:3177 start_codon:yes stop_codon:yes gene_type:complete
MKQFKVLDYDIIYLSYDEPNAEENYTNLLTKVPWAKRIHGVEGSDAAHKACAEIAKTKRFITIDGDNQIDEQFLNEVINFQEGVDLTRHVVSWTADNIINGLRYGNGGIKCWDRETVLKMKTHENADPDNIAAGIDFCWDLEYIQINSLMSTVHNNATPHQAWRAGFREGVKMCLIEGIKPAKKELIGNHWKNLERLYVWCMAGADVTNGLWAIYGAREGLHKTMCTDWEYINVRDFEYLNDLWKNKVQDESDLLEAIEDYGERILADIELPIAVTPLDAQQSKFFKNTYRNPPRPEHPYIRTNTTQFNTFSSNFVPTKKTEYDIVMISYDEANADENFNKLKTRFPRAQRIHGVKGIHQAHIAAANVCSTEMFWIVDGDAVIADDFNFDYIAEDNRAVHVWRSQNPINDLVYGYGGVKLFPTQMTRDMDTSRPDMTTSISDRFKKMEKISCITAFNSSEFSTWRSAFRECAKLSSKVIDRQKEDETNERLKTWTTVGRDRPFGEFALAGATAGMEFGLSSGSDLRLINDFNWLYEQFTETTDTTEEWQQMYNDKETTSNTQPVKIELTEIQADTEWKQTIPFKEDDPLPPRDNFIVDLLDRFEILYGDKVTNLRRFYNDGHMLDILRITGNEDLRKFVEERNYHSLFRYLEDKGIEGIEDIRKMYIEKNVHSLFRLLGKDHEELRKAITEDNVHSLFRLVGDEHEDLRKTVVEENLHSLFRLLGDNHEDLRKAVTEKNIHSLFRLLGDEYEDLRKAVTEKNVHSLFRLIDNSDTTEDLRKALVESNEMSLFRLIEGKDTLVEDIKKAGLFKNIWSIKRLEPSVTDEVNLTMDNNRHALWRVLEKYTGSLYVKPLEVLDKQNIKYDKDVMSRGQLKSKKWLVEEVKKVCPDLGTVFLCAGWYSSVVPMLQEHKIDFEKIRSFDLDSKAWKIAEIFNADLVSDTWKFKATTQDIMDIDYVEHSYTTERLDGTTAPLTEMPHTIINTSCEHIDNFSKWYDLLPEGRLIILQSNNYFSIEEHVNCSSSLQEFSASAPMQTVLYEGELDLGQYTRYMKIGRK